MSAFVISNTPEGAVYEERRSYGSTYWLRTNDRWFRSGPKGPWVPFDGIVPRRVFDAWRGRQEGATS